VESNFIKQQSSDGIDNHSRSITFFVFGKVNLTSEL